MAEIEGKMRARSGGAMALAAAVLWGFIGLAVRPLSGLGLTAVELTFVRSAAAFIGAAAMALCRGGSLRIRLRDLWIFLGSGLASVVFFNVCYFYTQKTLPLAVSSVFLYTAPFFVAGISAGVFGERLTAGRVGALAAAFIGCVMVSGALSGNLGNSGDTSNMPITLKGVAAGAGSGFGYALYTVFGRLAARRYSAEVFMAYTFFIASCALTPFVSVGHIVGAAQGGGGAALAAFALIFTLLPYLLYTASLGRLSGSTASALAFAEPLTSAAVGYVFFGERLTAVQAAGIILTAAALRKILKSE